MPRAAESVPEGVPGIRRRQGNRAPDFKAKAALAALRQDQTMAELARQSEHMALRRAPDAVCFGFLAAEEA